MSRKAMTERGANFPRNLLGSGPFEFVSYEPKRKVVTHANPTYWDDNPQIDRLEIMYLPETSSRTLAAVKGGIEMIESATVPGGLAFAKRQKP